jgi:hypothetical protein
MLFSFVVIPAKAASLDDLRLHYYFLRGSLAGQQPFAKSLNEFRGHLDQLRKDPINTNISIYEKSQQLVEANPKTATSGDSSQILSDLRSMSKNKYEGSAQMFDRLALYSIATRYLTSGPMRAPRAYEALGLQSEQELQKFREDIIFLTTKSNAGVLSAEEQQSLDLLFRYYTGVPTRLSKEQIMDDPLMLPVKESATIEGRLKAQMGGDLRSLVRSTQDTQNIVQTLRSQIEDQNLKRSLQDASTQVLQAKSFGEIDQVVNRLDDLNCKGNGQKSNRSTR